MRRKFDKKARRGYLVGYCGEKDGYRVWIPEESEVIVSRDVIFKTEKQSSVIFEYCSSKSEYDCDFTNSEEGDQNPTHASELL